MDNTIQLIRDEAFLSPGQFHVFKKTFEKEFYELILRLNGYKIDILQGQFKIFGFFMVDSRSFKRIYKVETGTINDGWYGLLRIGEIESYYDYDTPCTHTVIIDENLKRSVKNFLLI